MIQLIPILIASSARTNNTTPTCASSRRSSGDGAVELPEIVAVKAVQRAAPHACRVYLTAQHHMRHGFDAAAHFVQENRKTKHVEG